MDISYAIEPDLSAIDFQMLLRTSGLGARRPVDDLERLEHMLRSSQIIVTAREDGVLCGVARSITDWSYCLYCSDLCVDESFQGRGIGKALLKHTSEAAPKVKTYTLLSAPDAISFYEAAGYERHVGAFVFARGV